MVILLGLMFTGMLSVIVNPLVDGGILLIAGLFNF